MKFRMKEQFKEESYHIILILSQSINEDSTFGRGRPFISSLTKGLFCNSMITIVTHDEVRKVCVTLIGLTQIDAFADIFWQSVDLASAPTGNIFLIIP